MVLCLKAYIFVGFLKDTRDNFFYSPIDNNIFVSTNVTFLEKDYMKNYKPQSVIVIEKLLERH